MDEEFVTRAWYWISPIIGAEWKLLEFFFLGIRGASIKQVGADGGNWRGENVSTQITLSAFPSWKRVVYSGGQWKNIARAILKSGALVICVLLILTTFKNSETNRFKFLNKFIITPHSDQYHAQAVWNKSKFWNLTHQKSSSGGWWWWITSKAIIWLHKQQNPAGASKF